MDEAVLGACVRDQQEKFFYVYLTVEDSPHFLRDELNLHSERDVSLCQALLGGKVHVRGLHTKDLWVELPPFFDPAQSLLIPNEGIARSGGLERGHHFVKVALKVPAKIRGRGRELLLAYARLESDREGTVDGLEERDSHRYNVSVVEPKTVARSFNVIKKVADRPEESVDQFSRLSREKEKAKKEATDSQSVLSKLWDRLRQ